jgi:hypothetical protein
VRDVVPIIEENCTPCHTPDIKAGGLDLTSVAAMLAPQDDEESVVIPGEPDRSPLVRYIRGIYTPKMPKNRDELSEDELHIIRLWIAAGARDDSMSGLGGGGRNI